MLEPYPGVPLFLPLYRILPDALACQESICPTHRPFLPLAWLRRRRSRGGIRHIHFNSHALFSTSVACWGRGGGLKFVQGWLSHPPPALQPCLYYLNTFVLGMQFTKLHPDFLQGGRFSPGTILGGPYHLMWCHYPLNHIWLEATGTQLSWHCSHLPPFAAKSFLTLWNMIH